ncbi:MAG: hypothetical protein OHK0017_01290 [Patescibacteria group bacterium]
MSNHLEKVQNHNEIGVREFTQEEMDRLPKIKLEDVSGQLTWMQENQFEVQKAEFNLLAQAEFNAATNSMLKKTGICGH